MFFCRPHDSAEQKISVHCSENGLVNILQMLASQYSEAVSNIEMVPLGQVSSKSQLLIFPTINKFYMFKIHEHILMGKHPVQEVKVCLTVYFYVKVK